MLTKLCCLPIRSLLPALLCVQLMACGVEDSGFDTLTELPFGDGTVRIESAQSDEASEGAPIRVVLVEGDMVRVLYEASIANAGAALTPENIRPGIGPSSELTLCLNGPGQADVSVRINPNMNTIIESDHACLP